MIGWVIFNGKKRVEVKVGWKDYNIWLPDIIFTIIFWCCFLYFIIKAI